MSCFKYSFFFLIFVTQVHAAKFTSKECLNSEFVTNIKHEGKFFGLVKNNLFIKKNGCSIEVIFDNILETTWKIDICREPIHIKVKSKGNESFYKRSGSCATGISNDFCEYWGDLKENLQDYGLIYAEGERESISTSHGQTYCTYLLLQRYLDDAMLFSKYDEPKSIFGDAEVTQSKSLTISPPAETQDKPLPVADPADKDQDENQVIKLDEEPKEESNDDKPRF